VPRTRWTPLNKPSYIYIIVCACRPKGIDENTAENSKKKKKKKKKKKTKVKCSVCCEKRAIYARAGAEKPLRCGGCRVAGDVNVVDKKCGCGKSPTFGPPGGKKVHCAGCRVDGEVDLKNLQ
jgi:hypothetical protein